MSQNTNVVMVSSIHPIELAAHLFSASMNERASTGPLLVLYLGNREPGDYQKSQLVSHNALPLPFVVEERRGLFKPLFSPLGRCDQEATDTVAHNLRAYQEIARSISAHEVENRIDHLVRKIHTEIRIESGYSEASVNTAILNTVFDFFGVQDVQVHEYGNFVRTAVGRRAMKNALHVILNRWLKDSEVTSNRAKFTKGGYVHIEQEGRRRKYDSVALNDGIVSLVESDTGYKLNVEASGSLQDDLGNIELRGPLSYFFLRALGRPLDIPWYMPEVMRLETSTEYSCFEAISYVSNTAPSRTSKWMGGDGIRLIPCGYTLIEFDSDLVRRFVARVCCLDPKGTDDLSDWIHLVQNYPSSKQKLLKHQGAVSRYLQQKVRVEMSLPEFKNRTAESILDEVEYLSMCAATYGLAACKLLAISRTVNKYMREHSKPQLDRSTLLGRIFDLEVEVKQKILDWKASVLELANGHMLIGDNYDQNSMPKEYSLRETATEYYKLVAVLTAGVLKNHIWNLVILFDSLELQKHWADVLEQRGELSICVEPQVLEDLSS